MRSDGIHCRESACTGPVVLKVVLVTGAAFLGIALYQLMCAPVFPYPLLLLYLRGTSHPDAFHHGAGLALIIKLSP